MELPDGTILMHGKRPYDPRKAHEYYIRTRHLKGRKKGSMYTVKYKGGKTVKLTAKQLAEQKAYASERVAKIKKRLGELAVVVHKMRAEARTKDAKTKRESKKAPTAADKSKEARESKKYREKHKQEIATKSRTSGSKSSSTKSESKTDHVKALEKRIGEIRTSLTAAVEKQRALASATRG